MSKQSDRLISQYYNSPNIKGVLDNFESITDSLIDSVKDLKQHMGSNAKGYWLELLGRRFELPRPMMNDPENDAVFFGLVDNGTNTDNKSTFNKEPFAGDGSGSSISRVDASDKLYSSLLSLRLSAMRSNGTHPSISRIVGNIYEGSYVIDNQDMSMEVLIRTQGSSNDANIFIENKHIIPRPAGVSVGVESFAFFGFDETGGTFDNGAFK